MKRRSSRAASEDAAGAVRLPESGLASEILAAVDSAPAPRPPAGPERLYALAQQFAAGAASGPQAAPETPEIWVTFEVAGELFALPVDCVEEVLRVAGITRLPYAPSAVRGITHRRGRVLTVMDLRVRLGLEPAVLTPQSRICVVSSRGVSIGLLVDGARQVVRLLPSGHQEPPADVMTERSQFVTGIHSLEESLVILLDIDRILLLDDGNDPPAASEVGSET
jgi:purine-binding chemotaxis protein CheW